MRKKMKSALIAIAVVLFGAVNLSINDTPTNKINAEIYKVRAGDTFWDITHHYYNLDERNLYFLEYQDEIRELNPHLEKVHYQVEPNDLIQVRYITQKK